jgi:transposase
LKTPEWIHAVVRARAPKALICLDAFHAAVGCRNEHRRNIAAL